MLPSISFSDSKRHDRGGRRIQSGLRRWAVIWLMGVAALSVTAIPTQAEDSGSAVVALDNVSFTLTRTGGDEGRPDGDGGPVADGGAPS